MAKLINLVGNTPDPLTGGHCQVNDQTKFHMVKGIDNAFDLMEFCVLSYIDQLFQ